MMALRCQSITLLFTIYLLHLHTHKLSFYCSQFNSPSLAMTLEMNVNCSGLETHYTDVTTDVQNAFLLIYSIAVFVIGNFYFIFFQVSILLMISEFYLSFPSPGFLGDAIVLFCSISYMNVTYNIDNVTILFVKHLALADLLSLTTVVLPLAVLHGAQRWVLGCAMCYVLGVINNYPGLLHIHFILLISAHRLVRCVAPVKSSAIFTRNKAYGIVALIWIYCAILPLFVMFSQTEIRLITDSCTLDTYDVGSDRMGPVVMKGFWVLFICVPFVAVIIAILLLALTSLKLSGIVWNKNRKILITTFMIGGSFFVSWSPHIAFTIWRTFDESLSTSSLNRIPQYFHMISLCINPIIYTLVNRNFKNFMKEHARKVSEATTSFSTATGVSTTTQKTESLQTRVRRWTNFEIIFENSNNNINRGIAIQCDTARRFSYAPGVFREMSGSRKNSRKIAVTVSQPELSIALDESAG